MKYGFHEVIRPSSLDTAIAKKTVLLDGRPAHNIEKTSETHKVRDEAEALKYIIDAVKETTAGDHDYVAIELFTGTHRGGIDRINICHMHDTA